MKESYLVTSDFSNEQKPYHKHCGPTAMTNLIMSLEPFEKKEAATVFEIIAGFGKSHGIYWNTDRFKWMGGTSDVLSGYYLRKVFALFAVKNVQVHFGGLARPQKLRHAFMKHEVIYLQLHHHPRYGNHHLLLYGYEWRGFRAADGWKKRPVYLQEKDLLAATYFRIQLN